MASLRYVEIAFKQFAFEWEFSFDLHHKLTQSDKATYFPNAFTVKIET